MGRVRTYAAKYEPKIFGVILISYRDGEYYVVDGQHRVEVARIKGIKSVWCQVISGLTYEEEANLFFLVNNNKTRLNVNHKFHASVEAKDEEAMDIVRVLTKNGFRYSKEGNEKADNCISAIGSVKLIYRDSGIKGLDNVLRVLRHAWNGDRNSLTAEMIKGVNTFINNYKYDSSFLLKVLETDTPQGISGKARAYTQNIRRPNDGACFHIAKTIRDLYDEAAIKTKGKMKPCTVR